HTRGENRAMGYTGPGIACDWLDIEGPLFDRWPPASHLRLFGNLPMEEFQPGQVPNVRPPRRERDVQTMFMGRNKSDPIAGVWTVHSLAPLADADRLLADFLPRAFRRPVDVETRRAYLARVEDRLQAGDCFETAMRSAYQAALCSPDFLYHVEPEAALDDFALACRLSYFLWNSLPDEPLLQQAAAGRLREPGVLRSETERLLSDGRSQRFIDDFLGQWLKLRQIAANDPDKKLYPEFRPYLQDSMVAETRAYFRELLEKDLDASFLVRSNFVMVNEKLAVHYGIPGVSGSQIRRAELPAGCPRGGFLTQGAILKITANGTTTSPVPRGAFVIDRLLGEPPQPPPANVSAIEPDVRGATTIREQLAKHRADAVCASCHRRIDPPGFALESFDVIGGFRTRYRSIGDGDTAERGAIDPLIPLSFKLGPAVDSAGILPDGRTFADIQEYQALLAESPARLLRNLARQLAIYAAGRNLRFSDRATIDQIVRRTQDQGGGLRTLIHELVQSPLFSDGPVVSATSGEEFPSPLKWMTEAPTQLVADPPASAPVGKPPAAAKSADGWPTVRLRIMGIYAPHRADFFRQAMTQANDARLLSLAGDMAEAELAYDPDSDRFRGAKAEQLPERFDQLVRNLTEHTVAAKALSAVPLERIERLEIPLIGLDCEACSLGVYDILTRIDGVEQATASFRDGKAIAWIDPSRTDREAILKLLKQRDVRIAEQ
ncbi:MAG TPA: DUF1592 domain-containing protein, partial [Pirellulales bacterium]|nr:DUF1592 domain-containing protein [Pirellulales bacterium]